MQVRVKPKTYGPLRVASSVPEALTITTEAGHVAPGGLSPQAGAMSPSDLLLASLATCITISMRMAAQPMGLELGEVDASATATKAADLPNRFGRLEVHVRTGLPVPADRIEELLTRTKALCTVSNTLGAEVVVHLQG